MTTARDIVADALREGGILALGETLEAASLEEGLRRLNVLVKGTFGFDFGEPLTVYNIGNSGITTQEALQAVASVPGTSYVPANSAIHANLTEDAALYLDPSPVDGSRFKILDVAGNFNTFSLEVSANGKKIAGASSITFTTAGTTAEYFYREDLGDWVVSAPLQASDKMPFPSEFDDYFITTLAFRLSRRYGQEVSPETMETLRRTRSMFRARYAQKLERPTELALRRMSPAYAIGSDDNEFVRGAAWNY